MGDRLMKKQTLEQAIAIAMRGGHKNNLSKAATVLHGKPEGNWPDTLEAWDEMIGYLPFQKDRDYTAKEFVAAMYRVTGEDEKSAGRYAAI